MGDYLSLTGTSMLLILVLFFLNDCLDLFLRTQQQIVENKSVGANGHADGHAEFTYLWGKG